MKRLFVAAATCATMLAVQINVAYSADGKSKVKGKDKETVRVVSLEQMLRSNGYPVMNKETPPALKTVPDGLKSSYSPIIARYAGQYGVPVDLAHAVVSIESRFNPRARGSAGEVGLMQIKPATARAMGYRGSVKGLYDPETNIRFGMKYLAMAHQLGGGQVCGTILRYNAGHGAKRMNPISKKYCGKVQALID